MNIIKQIAEKTRVTLEQTSHVVKDKIEYLLQKPTLSIDELASFIAVHPNTSFSKKEYLGIRYMFYTLHIGDLHFHLETKGDQGEYILQLLIEEGSKPTFEYRSYKDRVSTLKNLKLSDTINEAVH